MKRKPPLIAAAVGLVLMVGIVGGLILPRASAVREKQEEVGQAREQETLLQLELDQLLAASKGANKARKQLSSMEAQIPPTADLPGLIRLLNTTAAQADLDFLSLAPGTPTVIPDGRLSAVPIQVTLIGRFFAVDEYLYLLEGLPRASKVLSLSLTSGPDGLPQLQVNAAVEFYTTDVSAGPGSIPGPTQAGGVPGSPSPVPSPEASPGPGSSPSPEPSPSPSPGA